MKAFSQLLEDVYGHSQVVAHSVLQAHGYKYKGSKQVDNRTKSVFGHPHSGEVHVYHDPSTSKVSWHHMNSRGRLKRSGEGHESLHSHLRITHA